MEENKRNDDKSGPVRKVNGERYRDNYEEAFRGDERKPGIMKDVETVEMLLGTYNSDTEVFYDAVGRILDYIKKEKCNE